MAIRSLLYLSILLSCVPSIAFLQTDTLPALPKESDSLEIQDLKRAFVEKENWEGLIQMYYDAANELFGEREFQAALEQYLKVDSIAQLHKIVNEATIRSIVKRSEISRTAFTQQSTDYAHLLLEEALASAKEVSDQESIHYIYIYLADTSGLKGEYEKAKKYIDLALEYFLALDKKEYEPHIARLYMISTAYFKVNDRIDKAEEAYLKGIAFCRAKKNKKELAKLLYYYGHFQGSYTATCKEAMVSLLESKSIFDSLQITDTYDYERLNRDIADCYYENNDHENSSKYYRIAYDLKANLSKKANREISRRVETQYQTEKKEQQIALLNAEKELIEQQKANQRNLLMGGIGITSLIGIFLFVQYRNRKKTNDKLRELDRVKSNFFANISHEFRTPLTLINAPLEKKLGDPNLKAKERSDLKSMERNSRRLLNLVDQLLDLSKLEVGKYFLNVKQGDLGTLVKAISESFRFSANEKNITYEVEVKEIPNAWYDADVMEKIVTNLLSNAIKYTSPQGNVKLKLSIVNDRATLQVRNTPTEIDPGAVGRLFERFYQADENTEGVGIGLSLVKELTELIKGNISVTKPEDKCISFELEFPISKNSFKVSEIDESEVNVVKEEVVISQGEVKTEGAESADIEITDDADILLVVEDNTDVRQLVRGLFEDLYTVIEATNGQEGIKMAINHIPDLIISDIMIPDVDGIQLLKTIKSDERTSHIPVILLTAKAGEEDQYKGLSTGADAYVTKPFTLKLLEARVSKLIESRKKLRDRYSQEVILKPKDIAITNLDEQFLERVQEVLDLKLTESDFNVQEFSDAVGLSRMQMHRKLKALTGLSASEFVRSQRLKLAASLLKKSDTNVSQIGYEVGFNDPSYFAKCFKEAYGVSPTAYSKKPS